MEPMEAKTETSLTGSRLPGPLAAGCWRAELPGPSMSTCLPLPPPDSRLSLFPSFSALYLLFFTFLRLFLTPTSPCLADLFISSRGEGAARTLLLLLPLSLARAPNRYAVKSRFTQIRPRTPSSCGEAVR